MLILLSMLLLGAY